MTEINKHMRCRGTFMNLDDVTFKLVARTKLHYFLLQNPTVGAHQASGRHSISAKLFPQRFLPTTVPSVQAARSRPYRAATRHALDVVRPDSICGCYCCGLYIDRMGCRADMPIRI
jgi:hypothetical protein